MASNKKDPGVRRDNRQLGSGKSTDKKLSGSSLSDGRYSRDDRPKEGNYVRRDDKSGRATSRDSSTGRFIDAYPGDPIPEPLKTKPKKKN